MGLVRSGLGLVLALSAVGAMGADFSTDAANPTPVPPTGRIVGGFPADEVSETYYFAAPAAAGSLVIRGRLFGSGEVTKELDFALMEGERRAQVVSLGGAPEGSEQVQVVEVKSPGRQVFAVTTRGPSDGRFCLLLGGAAFPTPGNVQCDSTVPVRPPAPPAGAAIPSVPPPSPAAAAPEAAPAAVPAPVPAAAPEPCERRIRFETDDLFAGSSATLRDDAGPLLAAVGRQLLASQQQVRVECDIDAPGDAGLRLSQARAAAVREFFVAFGVRAGRVDAQGFGASRPLKPEARPGSAAAVENRRIEIVICPS